MSANSRSSVVYGRTGDVICSEFEERGSSATFPGGELPFSSLCSVVLEKLIERPSLRIESTEGEDEIVGYPDKFFNGKCMHLSSYDGHLEHDPITDEYIAISPGTTTYLFLSDNLDDHFYYTFAMGFYGANMRVKVSIGNRVMYQQGSLWNYTDAIFKCVYTPSQPINEIKIENSGSGMAYLYGFYAAPNTIEYNMANHKMTCVTAWEGSHSTDG